jgi:hypothetical protein
VTWEWAVELCSGIVPTDHSKYITNKITINC